MKKIIIVFITLLLVGCDLSLTKIDQENYMKPVQIGTELLENGNAKEALEYFIQAEPYANGDDLVYNNMSWAYNELEEFNDALVAIKKALELPENSAVEYTNAGNAYLGLDEYDLAIEHYLKAIELDESQLFSLYGLGTTYFFKEMYNDAYINFAKVLEIEDDYDSYIGVIEALLMLGEYDQALEYVDQALDIYENDYELLKYKGHVFEVVKSDDETILFYNKLYTLFPSEETILNVPWYHYNKGQYSSAVDLLIQAIELYPTEQTYYLLLHSLKMNHQLDEAEMIGFTMLDYFPESFDAYNGLGLIYVDKNKPLEAVDYFIEACKYTNESKPYTNAIITLFNAQRYQRAIDFGIESLNTFEDNIDLLLYVAYSYYQKDDHSNSLKYYKKILELYPEEVGIHYDLAEAYYYLDDIDSAQYHISTYLKDDPSNADALYLKDMINYKGDESSVILSKLFEENYLYDYDLELSKTQIENLSNEEVDELFQKIKLEDDPFSYMLYGEVYDYVTSDKETIVSGFLNEETVYIGIQSFDNNTDNLFIETIDDLIETENLNLVIDLRNNGGGSTDSSNNILNALLPECVTSQIIYKNGYTFSYYSDASMVPFNHIYVLVDGNSASVSELLALSLKTYLNNVTIIGESTFGKGVGQNVYNDSINGRLYYIVDHYWNVRQQNISGVGVKPDIEINTDKVNEYLEVKFGE